MSKQILLWRPIGAPSTAATTYCGLGNGQVWYGSADEDDGTNPWAAAGTFSNLKVTLTTAPGSGKSIAFTVRIEGVDTALTVTIANTDTTATLTGVTVAVAAYDLVTLKCVPTGSPTSPGEISISCDFNSTVARQQCYSLASGQSIGATRVNRPLFAVDNSGWTASNATCIVGIAGTINGYGIYIRPVISAGTCEFSITKNGVEQDGAGGTVDTRLLFNTSSPAEQQVSFSLPVSPGDILSFTAQQASNTIEASFCMLFTSDVENRCMLGASKADIDNAATYYSRPTGGNPATGISTTESGVQITAGVTPFTLSGLRVGINNSFAGYTFTLRKNTANSAITCTIASGTSASDLVNSVAFASGDLLAMSIAPVGSPASRSAGWVLQADVGPELQYVTQLVELVSWGEDADADPPPEVTACSGNGTVASGTNPAAGTALAGMTTPYAWIETTIGGTAYSISTTAIPYGTPKTPGILEDGFSPFSRGLSDGDGGFETPVLTVRFSDTNRFWRGLMASGVLVGSPFDAYVADFATLQAGGTGRRRFHGIIRNYRPLPGLKFEIQAEDALTAFLTSANAEEKQVPARLISSQISDRNPLERVTDKPVPVIAGSCSDENEDDPTGVVPCLYIGSETPEGYDDNLHKFLVCGHALKNVQSVFLANYVSGGDEPTTRIKAPESAYGSVIWVPHQDGWFLDDEFTDQADERYTFLYGLDGHPAIELARTGRIPILVNVCGLESVGDATGTMLSNPGRIALLLLNNRLAQEATANWLSILSLGSYTLFDTTTFEAIATICTARGYVWAGIIGADYQQMGWRDFIATLCRNGDFDCGPNRHGQIILAMLDRTSAYSSATTFDAYTQVIQDSLIIDPKPDRVENEIQYLYKRNYVEALHDIAVAEGARPNRDPYDGKWFSGLQTDADESVITEMGGRPLGLRQSRIQEYSLIRDEATAEDVARQRRERWKRPRADVTFSVPMDIGDTVEIGDVIKLTHFGGVGSSGYTSRRLQVRRITDDLINFLLTFECLDVENLLA